MAADAVNAVHYTSQSSFDITSFIIFRILLLMTFGPAVLPNCRDNKIDVIAKGVTEIVPDLVMQEEFFCVSSSDDCSVK